MNLSFLKLKSIKFISFCFLTIFLMFSHFACKNTQPTQNNAGIAVSELSKSGVVNYKTIEKELEKLLHHLSKNPAILTPDQIKDSDECHRTIPELGLVDKFTSEFLLEDGNTFEVHVELFCGSAENGPSVEDAEVYFMLDPNRFPMASQFTANHEGAEFFSRVAATTHNKSKGLYKDEKSLQKLKLQSKSEKVNYLLFFVGGEEVLSAEKEEQYCQEMLAQTSGLAKAQSKQTSCYWWLTRLRLKTKHDYSSEEFELFRANGCGTSYYFPASTHMRFDGGNHTDDSGYLRKYPNVNSKRTYTPEHPIAIRNVNWNFQLAAIEDDASAGAHKNDHHGGGGKHNHYLWGWKFPPPKVNISGTYHFWIHDDVTDDDDIYSASLTGYSGGMPTTEIHISTTDVDYYVRLGTVSQAGSW